MDFLGIIRQISTYQVSSFGGTNIVRVVSFRLFGNHHIWTCRDSTGITGACSAQGFKIMFMA